MTYSNDIELDQLILLAKKHGWSLGSAVTTVVFSFMMAIAHISAAMNSEQLNPLIWAGSLLAGVGFGATTYVVIYFTQGVVLVRQTLGEIFEGLNAYQVDEGVVEDTVQSPTPPARAKSQTAPPPVDSLMKQLSQAVDWYDEVDWGGLASHVTDGGGFSKTLLAPFVPFRVYVRYQDGNPISETFPEAMIRLKWAERFDSPREGYLWTNQGLMALQYLMDELEPSPPTPDDGVAQGR